MSVEHPYKCFLAGLKQGYLLSFFLTWKHLRILINGFIHNFYIYYSKYLKTLFQEGVYPCLHRTAKRVHDLK